MNVSLHKLNKMSNVISAEIVEYIFNRKGKGEFCQQAQQQEEERRHPGDGGGWWDINKSTSSIGNRLLFFDLQLGGRIAR